MEYRDRHTRGATISLTEYIRFDEEFDEFYIYMNGYGSDLVALLVETGRAETITRTIAESEINPRITPGHLTRLPAHQTSPKPMAEDPDRLRRKLETSWDEAQSLLVRWLMNWYLYLFTTVDDDPNQLINIYRGYDHPEPPTGWRDLLFFRLYRAHAPLPDRFADAFEAALADDHHELSESTWRDYRGWLAHQLARTALGTVVGTAEKLDERLVPRVREMLADDTRTRRRRQDPDAPTPGSLRHRIDGIRELSEDVADIHERLHWLELCLGFIHDHFADRDLSPPDALPREPTREHVLQDHEQISDALHHAADTWMDWPDGESRRRLDASGKRAHG